MAPLLSGVVFCLDAYIVSAQAAKFEYAMRVLVVNLYDLHAEMCFIFYIYIESCAHCELIPPRCRNNNARGAVHAHTLAQISRGRRGGDLNRPAHHHQNLSHQTQPQKLCVSEHWDAGELNNITKHRATHTLISSLICSTHLVIQSHHIYVYFQSFWWEVS